jgi:hypothetical protein
MKKMKRVTNLSILTMILVWTMTGQFQLFRYAKNVCGTGQFFHKIMLVVQDNFSMKENLHQYLLYRNALFVCHKFPNYCL